jgi:hypothetical protein
MKAQTMIVEGHTHREIGRTLRMSEHTVAKIIRSEDFQNFIREQRERLFGIAPIAMDSLVAGVATDPHLAYALLKDLGIIPARDLMLALMPVSAHSDSLSARVQLLVDSPLGSCPLFSAPVK